MQAPYGSVSVLELDTRPDPRLPGAAAILCTHHGFGAVGSGDRPKFRLSLARTLGRADRRGLNAVERRRIASSNDRVYSWACMRGHLRRGDWRGRSPRDRDFTGTPAP